MKHNLGVQIRFLGIVADVMECKDKGANDFFEGAFDSRGDVTHNHYVASLLCYKATLLRFKKNE